MCEPNPDWVPCEPEEHALNGPALYAAIVGSGMTEDYAGHYIQKLYKQSPWSDPNPPQVGRVEVEPPKPHSRVIFRKVYKGIGYWTDPRNDKARAIEASMNLDPQPHGTVDYRPLRKWLADGIN